MHFNRGFKLAKQGNHRPLGKVDVDETMIAEVRRHPIGLISLYILSGIGLVTSFAVVVYILPSIMNTSATEFILLAIGVLVLATILVVLGLWIATVVYTGSVLIVTNKNLTQTIQYGLFSKKTSQLSMANVEDVTADQNGFVPTLFNYGTLRVETAGEQSNFHFIYCPHPTAVAKEILEARERYIEHPRG